MPTSLMERTMAEPLAQAAGLSGPIEVRILEGAAAMHDAMADWRRLALVSEDPDISFQSFGWCAAWLSAFGAPDRRPLILLASQATRPLALMPMMLRTNFGITRAIPMGDPHCQVANALCVPGPSGVAALAACLDALEQRNGVDTIELHAVPSGSSLAAALGPQTLMTDEATALSVVDCRPFADADSYIASLSKNRRRDFRRKVAKLEQDAPVATDFLRPGDNGFARALATGLLWKRAWLRSTRTVSLPLADQRTDAFFDALSAAGAGTPTPEVQVLRVGDRPIAVALNIVGTAPHGQRACYLCAHDPAFHAASPGTLTHQIGIRRSIQDGLPAYSLLGHPTAFKRVWTDLTIPLLRHDKALTAKGHVWLTGWTHGLRPLARGMVHAVSRKAGSGA